MKMRRRFRAIAAAGLVAILLGQISILLHEVSADHPPEEACWICIGSDRLSTGLPASLVVQPFDAALAVFSGVCIETLASRRPATTHSRDPPVL